MKLVQILRKYFLNPTKKDILKKDLENWVKENKGKSDVLQQINEAFSLYDDRKSPLPLSPLAYAAVINDYFLAVQLVEAGARFVFEDENLEPLCLAVTMRHYFLTEFLCQKGAPVRAQHLIHAINNEEVDTLKVLMKHLISQNPTLFDEHSYVALMVVLQKSKNVALQRACFEAILSRPSPSFPLLFQMAMEFNCEALLDELIRLKVDPYLVMQVGEKKEDCINLIQLTYKYNRPAMRKKLLENGFNPDFGHHGLRLIHHAIPVSLEAVDELVRHGATVDRMDNDDYSPILQTVVTENIHAARKLLSLGANPNGYAGDPFFPITAAFEASNPLPLIKLLLSHPRFDFDQLIALDHPLMITAMHRLLGMINPRLVVWVLSLESMPDRLRQSILGYWIIFSFANDLLEFNKEAISYGKKRYGLKVFLEILECLEASLSRTTSALGTKGNLVITHLKELSHKLTEEMRSEGALVPIYYSPSVSSGTSARSYLTSHHLWAKEDFARELEERKEREKQLSMVAVSAPYNIASTAYTWFNGRLHSSLCHKIENAGFDSFLYIPPHIKDEKSDSSDSLSIFANKSRFIFSKRCIKDVSHANIKVWLLIDGKTDSFPVTHELTMTASTDRLLCVSSGNLLIGVTFVKGGIHTLGSLRELQSKSSPLTIDFPSLQLTTGDEKSQVLTLSSSCTSS